MPTTKRIPSAKMPSVKMPSARRHLVRKPIVRKATVWTRPIIPAVIEEPMTNVNEAAASEQDIMNRDEPPSYSSPPPYEPQYAPPYEVEEDNMEYKLEPINSSVEQMPDISYGKDEDLSYRE